MATSQTAGGAVNPQVPIANLGNTYVNGMRLTYTSTTSFTVGIGQCRDSTDTVDIIMGGNQYNSSGNPGAEQGLNNTSGVSAPVVVSISSNWSATQAGLDVGTIAASTMYSVFAIADSRGFNAGSAILTLKGPASGPSMPLGYDTWRYIGSISTDATPHVRKFTQTGAQALRTMWYDPGTGATTQGVAIPSSPLAPTTSEVYKTIGTLLSLVPQQPQLELILNASFIPAATTAGQAIMSFAPYGSTGAYTSFTGLSTTLATDMTVRVPAVLNAAATPVLEADVTSYATGDAWVITLNGYIDQL